MQNNQQIILLHGKKITSTKSASSIVLSTGASNDTCKMNIFDFAGNEWEWTLEKILILHL